MKGTEMLSFTVQSDGSPVSLTPKIVALTGYTSRDQEAVQAHIEELEKLGVERPTSWPVVFAVTADRLTTESSIEVLHGETSGEIEFVIILTGGKRYMAIASDHTDRKNENLGIGIAKQLVPRVISREVWRWEEVEDHWDELEIKSHVVKDGNRTLYQSSTTGSFLPVDDIIEFVAGRSKKPLEDAVIFSGTVPTIGGKMGYASRFEAEMFDPIRDRTLSIGYDVIVNDSITEVE